MPVDPRYIRLPAPEPPTAELLAAVDAFYGPDNGMFMMLTRLQAMVR
jgi:hypothetical protein